MDTSKLKEYWQKIFSRQEQDRDKMTINPGRVWFVLVCLFFIGLVISLGGLVFLRNIISQKEEDIVANSGLTSEKLNEQKLKLILIDSTKRIEEFKNLELAKPKVVDPGL